MSDKVLTLIPKTETTATEVTASVVRVLGELLDKAKQGHVQGLSCVLYDRAREMTIVVVPGVAPETLLGGIIRAQHRLAMALE